MGSSAIHSEAAQSEGLVNASYTILKFDSTKLPEEYLGLIFAKWLKSLRYGNDMFRLIDVEAYYKSYHQFVGSILGRNGTLISVAVLTDDHDVALGFSVSRGNVLDYVYVDKYQRKLGIGRSLVPAGIDTITHVTKTGLTIWGSKAGHWKFNPFA